MDCGITNGVLKMGREEALYIHDKLGTGGQTFSCHPYIMFLIYVMLWDWANGSLCFDYYYNINIIINNLSKMVYHFQQMTCDWMLLFLPSLGLNTMIVGMLRWVTLNGHIMLTGFRFALGASSWCDGHSLFGVPETQEHLKEFFGNLFS